MKYDKNDAVESFVASIMDLVPILHEIKDRGEMKRIRVRVDIDLTEDRGITSFETAFNVWDEHDREGVGRVFVGKQAIKEEKSS